MADRVRIRLYGFPLMGCVPRSMSMPYKEGLTVGDAVAYLLNKHPALKRLLPQDQGHGLAAHIITVVNGRDSRPDQRLNPGDQVFVLSPPEGG